MFRQKSAKEVFFSVLELPRGKGRCGLNAYSVDLQQACEKLLDEFHKSQHDNAPQEALRCAAALVQHATYELLRRNAGQPATPLLSLSRQIETLADQLGGCPVNETMQ